MRVCSYVLRAVGVMVPLVVSIAHADVSVAEREFACLMEAGVGGKVGPGVTGVISRVHVDRGDLVKEGQIVAELDADVQKAIVALARAKATNEFQILSHRSRKEFLSKKLERVQTLQKKDFASVAALDEAIADAKVVDNAEKEAILNRLIAQLELEREEATLNQRVIRSPINGIVTERVLFTGEYRNETNHLLTIAQIDPLNVEVVLPVAYYGQIAVGAEADITPEQPVAGRYKAKVVVVDRVLDAGSGTFGVRLELPNAGNALPAGIRCSVRFKPGKRP